MSKRRKIAEQLKNQQNTSLSDDMARVTFGDDSAGDAPAADAVIEQLRRAEAQAAAQNVTKLDIMQVYPDPQQPRRALPSAIRHRWDGNPHTVSGLFVDFMDLVNAEREHLGLPRVDFVMLSSNDEAGHSDMDEARRPLEIALRKIFDLATSIRRDDLTNPITVTREAEGYRIETGERRWLAYHLIYFMSQNPAWSRIPARIIPEASVWTQATENTARADLNAISMTRQFAVLLMDMLQQEQGHTFKSFARMVPPGACDRAFYAQVADGDKYRVPRGQGPDIVNALGVKNTQQLREYRKLLSLPDEVWEMADDYNWSLGRLREMLREAQDNPNWLVEIAYQERDLMYAPPTPSAGEEAANSGYTVSIDTVYGPDGAEEAAAPDGVGGLRAPAAAPPPQDDIPNEALLLFGEKRSEYAKWARYALNLPPDLRRVPSEEQQQARHSAAMLRAMADRIDKALGLH